MQIQHYCAIGDSITDRRNHFVDTWYYDWLNRWWYPKALSLFAVSGATISGGFNSMTVYSRMVPASCDLLTIYGGINDFGRNQPLGQLGDATPDTFYGALDQMLSQTLQDHPQTAVYFISHVKIGRLFFPPVNPLGLHQADYEKAIADVTAAYSVPHLSLYQSWLDFSIPEMAARYSLDTLHPNDAGQLVIARMIKDFIEAHG